MESVTIVGAGVVGHASAVALRGLGYTGSITILGSERHRPYDRPPLGRGFLTGQTTIGELALEAPHEDLDADWRLGVGAVALDAAAHRVTLANGRTVDSDAVVLATGSAARRLGEPWHGVHTLRTVEDALALREELLPGARMVVVGSGVVGLEVASTAHDLGLQVTVLGSTTDSLCTTFGATVADAVFGLHRRRGITVRTDLRVAELIGPGWVSGVRLTTGEEIGADVVLLDIGAEPIVGWLAGSGLDLFGVDPGSADPGPSGSDRPAPDDRGAVLCDTVGATAVPGVVAVGDCAAWLDPVSGRHRRIPHWSDTRDRPGIAMAALLGVDPGAALAPITVTSHQAGALVQFAGRLHGDELLTIEAGSVNTGDLLAVYRRGDLPVAVLGIDQAVQVASWQARLAATAPTTTPTPAPDEPVRDASVRG
ncbi:NAD(P)/FAD-dependent oxidoreductase [Cryobacterium sp. 1639]|uniref:NAD(P)/FAD-dependent oxidoreductase n=1 Tax=Cryobacterium inferilacus TaxID=2866629 RepID=UPI001C73503F|nr:NAD(P)/FAD-dependent oxidoreductase [Cryobacterium sp. 1639]MBX0300208.1 NAD(P)/FAD-dependent oxidoreductase [Cryobacterium sp. 1639]